MTRDQAEQIITEYLAPIFGFALKRCKNTEDAEDLSQEIVLRAFRALLIKDDIIDTGKFIWTIAHNALSNYYRSCSRCIIGSSIDEISEWIADPDTLSGEDDNTETIRRLQGEIAYLSKLQRRIVIAYYFENRKQADIAAELDIPIGTVKWHLFEAKKELKRGMDTMRQTSELKFNPVKFTSIGINGSSGLRTAADYLRSSLAQNICYCVRDKAKSVNEIADDLGVSPVYVESEIEALEEYGFVVANSDRYIVNFIISKPTPQLLIMQDAMYKRAASLLANELYDELVGSGILDDPDILCGQTDDPITLTSTSRKDHNFMLWTLIPYIAARSGERLMEEHISFDEVATIRPDGGHNIVHACIAPGNKELPDDYVYMSDWCGPMFVENDELSIWQIDHEWSDRGKHHGFLFSDEALRMLSLYAHEDEVGVLSKDEYVWLTEHGYVKTNGDYDGYFKSSWQVVCLANREIKERLLAIGDRIKSKYHDEFEAIKEPYAKAFLECVPAHLKRVKAYELQYVFHDDGWFLLHCIHALLNNGKLKPPTEGQKKSLTTLIAPK